MKRAATLLLAWVLVGAARDETATGPSAAYTAAITEWRGDRVARLTSDTGWLTLVGLYWFKPGENTFGRDPGNALALDRPALAARAGTFAVQGANVRFTAAEGAGITHAGDSVTSIEMAPDTSGDPTVLGAGTLQFYVIERMGHLGLRVRDTASPRRTGFKGLDYFPIDASWDFNAQFHPYQPAKQVPITNILGMVDNMTAPGYLTFNKDGHEWRLDALLEAPDANELFLMFADATSGRETYGAGRYMYVPLPNNGTVPLDFNKAYNPPCAFNEFATCPLPPRQNRLKLRIEAGEKAYGGAAH
jgi:uncharacterized protein (DUF1684 family)